MSQQTAARQTYSRVFACLIGLTLLTVGVAFLNLGPFNTIIALTIATIKALLVVLFFMHLRDSNTLTWLILSAGIFWLVLLIAGTLHDFLTRGWYTVTGV